MASPSVTAEMCNEHDAFMCSCNATPIELPLIGLEEASNIDMEAIWQLFIPQLQANKKLWCLFHHTSNFWGFFYSVNGLTTINSCNPQLL
jgi:hypothetical protein